MKLSTIANYLDGRLIGADGEFTGVAHDTRKFPLGALYVALQGERFDGHDFVPAARDNGASGALVGRILDAPLHFATAGGCAHLPWLAPMTQRRPFFRCAHTPWRTIRW